MGVIEAKLAAMGYTLAPPHKFPNPNRRGCVRVENILYLSGHGPFNTTTPIGETGKLGATMTDEEGYKVARIVAVSMLATIKGEIGDLDRVKQVIRLFGMVNCTPDFGRTPQIIDGASDLFYELYGPVAGCHARSAVGMSSLPRGMAVEINGEFLVEA